MDALLSTGALPAGGVSGYAVDNSVKLEHANNEWFYRASPTEGNRRTFTFSFWIKRSRLGNPTASGTMYVAGQGQHGRMYFTSDYFGFRFDDGHDTRDITTKHRDPSAWLHVVVAVDTNQSSSSNRVKIYFNGVQTTNIDFDGGSYPDLQDQASGWFTTNYLTVGTAPFGGSYNVGDGDYDMSGYLAEFCAVDGQQLAPTDFGETNADGVWVPKDVSGINFGSQGYYLDFADASDLGDDESGNGNDFVENNLAAADQATDTPTNNFCTFNELGNYIQRPILPSEIKEGATKLSHTDISAWCGGIGTMGVKSGKWYYEAKIYDIDDLMLGFSTFSGDTSTTTAPHSVGTNIVYYGGGASGGYWFMNIDGTSTSNDANRGTVWSVGDVIGIALDIDNTRISFYVNGTLAGAPNTNAEISAVINEINSTGDFLIPFAGMWRSTIELNFGGYTSNTPSSAASDANGYGNFEYAPPSGYYALCTKNLAEYG